MPNFLRCIGLGGLKKRKCERSDSENSKVDDVSASLESKVEGLALVPIAGSSSSAETPRGLSSESNAAEALEGTQSTRQTANRQIAIASIFQQEDCRHRDKKRRERDSSTQIPNTSEDGGKELEGLEELARLRVIALSYLNSPFGREPDPSGFVTKQVFRPRVIQMTGYQSKYVPIVEHRLVKIDTQPDIGQNCYYEVALYQATLQQVREQYELHCRRLENIRRNVSSIQGAYRKEWRLWNMDYDAWCSISLNLQLRWIKPIVVRAQRAFDEAQCWYEERSCSKIAEQGAIRLIERCEAILQKADKKFVPKLWQPIYGNFKKRWADGKRGWTGLVLSDMV